MIRVWGVCGKSEENDKGENVENDKRMGGGRRSSSGEGEE
jgi:hypothetical protein